MDANSPQLFACGRGGTASAAWIQPGHSYAFSLYNATSCSASGRTGSALQSVTIKGQLPAEQINGYVNGITNNNGPYVISGWSCVSGNSKSISVDFYAGGPIGTGTFIGNYAANAASSASLGSSQCNSTGLNYTYYITLAASTLQTYKGQSIYIYGHAADGQTALLSGASALKIPSDTINGYVNGISNVSGPYVIGGWACVSGNPKSISVDFYAGGPAGTGTFAGNFPATVATAASLDTGSCNSTGLNYGYYITLTPAMMQSYAGKAVYIYGHSSDGQTALLPGSGIHNINGPSQLLNPQIWFYATLYNPPRTIPNQPAWWDKRNDTWQMFSGTTQWPTVFSKVSVVMTGGPDIQAACLEERTADYPQNCSDLGIDNSKSLDQYFRFVKANNIHSALGIGLLLDEQVANDPALNEACGLEAYGSQTANEIVFRKIQSAITNPTVNGSLDYIQMDEPFYYGTVSCKDSAANVAAGVAKGIAIAKQYFPNVQIGDVEPTDGTAGDPALIAQWADAFAAATGKPLVFFQADAPWSSDAVVQNFGIIDQAMHSRSIPFGVIYDGLGYSDSSWTQSAIGNFAETESAFDIYPDQAIFASWMANPTLTLPETTPGTLMNVAYQYLLPKTYLSINASGTAYNVNLSNFNGAPIANAPLQIQSVDIADAWAPTVRTITGTVPANAAYAVVAIRANMEGSTMVAPSGAVSLGAISINYTDATNAAQTWKSSYTTPLQLNLSPSTTYMNNLNGTVVCGGLSAISLAPNSSYTLSVPMSATGSADHAGFVALIYLDSNCNGISRDYLYFGPSTMTLNLSPSVTNSSGNLSFNASMPVSELRAYYTGDNAANRSSMAIFQPN